MWKSVAKTDKVIADGLGISVNTVRRCIDRYLSSGIDLTIFDDERSGRPTEITDDAKSWLQKHLKKMDIKPFKIKYYLERKDPDFGNKMHDVLLVYKQVEMQLDDSGTITIPDSGHMTHTVSYDENRHSGCCQQIS